MLIACNLFLQQSQIQLYNLRISMTPKGVKLSKDVESPAPPQASCMDRYEFLCAVYDSSPQRCGRLDTPTFVATEACCACGGGLDPRSSPHSHRRLFSFGFRSSPPPSPPPSVSPQSVARQPPPPPPKCSSFLKAQAAFSQQLSRGLSSQSPPSSYFLLLTSYFLLRTSYFIHFLGLFVDPPSQITESPASQSSNGWCGVLWFFHIPKTGGTTVKDYLETLAKQADGRLVDLGWGEPGSLPCRHILHLTSYFLLLP